MIHQKAIEAKILKMTHKTADWIRQRTKVMKIIAGLKWSWATTGMVRKSNHMNALVVKIQKQWWDDLKASELRQKTADDDDKKYNWKAKVFGKKRHIICRDQFILKIKNL